MRIVRCGIKLDVCQRLGLAHFNTRSAARLACTCTRIPFLLLLFKSSDGAEAADTEACVPCREGGGVQILCLRRSEAETQMSENKNSPEKGGQILLVSQLCTMKRHFVRARVFNWLRVLTSLHALFFFLFFLPLPLIPGQLPLAPWLPVCKWRDTVTLSFPASSPALLAGNCS